MNKAIAAHNLLLPSDMINHICSFLFYTKEESRKRNKQKYTRVIREIKRIQIDNLYSWGYSNIPCTTIIKILPKYHTLIISHICKRCNNYVKKIQNHHFICHCV